MEEGTRETLKTVIRESTLIVFDGLGTPLVPNEGVVDRTRHTFAASIGYMGTGVRGALTIMTTHTLVEAIRPPELRDGTRAGEEALADWIGEVSNQLLGRIKNRLVRFGVTIRMSTPVVVTGVTLRQRHTTSIVTLEEVFQHNGEPLLVFFEADGVFALAPEREVDDSIAEGDIELF